MKNDTSNIIDLDNILNPKEEEKQPIVEIVETLQPIQVDFDEILAEWSYRLPKGFPTVVDGRFTEREEVQILNELLEERGLQSLELPEKEIQILNEARPHEHLNSKYVPNFSTIDAWKAVDIDDIAQFADSPFVAVDSTQVSTKDKIIYIKGSKVVAGNGSDVKNMSKTSTFWKSEALPNTYLVIDKSKTNAVIEFKGAASTDTDVKEGLVFALFNSSVTEPFRKENYNANLQKLLKDISKSKSLGSTAYTRVVDFVTRASKAKPDPKIISIFNQTLSQALRLKDYKDFVIERDVLFKNIRDAASQTTGEPADKWCPGDVYLVKKGSQDAIYDALQQALENTAVGYVNNLFINDWGKTTTKTGGVVVAVSLKMAKAQAGKAKAYLKRFTEDDTVYNVTSDELQLPFKGITDGIKRLRYEIKNILSKSKEVDFIYNPPKDDIRDEKVARMKYAVLKLMKYLFEREKDPAASLRGALQFGMSLSGVNPTFFKVVGKVDGTRAEVEEFEAGEQISFFSDDPKKTPVIKVEDVNTANSMQFNGTAVLGDELLDFNFLGRSNGAAQATLEIQKLKPRKN